MRKKKQQELKKLDLTDEEIKEIQRLSRFELFTDVVAFIALLVGAGIVFMIFVHIVGK